MSDITMCPDRECPKAPTCHRSEQSGTPVTPHWQSWFTFSPREGITCKEYWPVAITDKES